MCSTLVTRLDDIAAGIEAAQRDIQRFSEFAPVARARRPRRSPAMAGRCPRPRRGRRSGLRVTDVYTTDTGNGFYGAYQFTLGTWRSVGGTGNPAQAQPSEQDARARALYARSGPGPGPCAVATSADAQQVEEVTFSAKADKGL